MLQTERQEREVTNRNPPFSKDGAVFLACTTHLATHNFLLFWKPVHKPTRSGAPTDTPESPWARPGNPVRRSTPALRGGLHASAVKPYPPNAAQRTWPIVQRQPSGERPAPSSGYWPCQGLDVARPVRSPGTSDSPQGGSVPSQHRILGPPEPVCGQKIKSFLYGPPDSIVVASIRNSNVPCRSLWQASTGGGHRPATSARLERISGYDALEACPRMD